jgi:hypothetical protein
MGKTRDVVDSGKVTAHLCTHRGWRASPPYTEVPAPEVELPKRLTASSDYQRPPREEFSYVPDYPSKLLGDPES